MNDTFWKKHQPPDDQPAFMSSYPFNELAEGGWSVNTISAPRQRPGLPGHVRVVTLTDQHGRLVSADVDDHNRMRGHATFSRDDNNPALYALTTRATALLAGSDPDANYPVLAALKDVKTLNELQKTHR